MIIKYEIVSYSLNLMIDWILVAKISLALPTSNPLYMAAVFSWLMQKHFDTLLLYIFIQIV